MSLQRKLRRKAGKNHMASKFIYCDETAHLKIATPDGVKDVEFGIAQFVTFLCDGKKFRENGAGVRRAARVVDACDNPEADGAIKLDSEAWRLVADEAEAPTNGYPLNPAARNAPFIDAIRDAVDEPKPAPAAQPEAPEAAPEVTTEEET